MTMQGWKKYFAVWEPKKTLKNICQKIRVKIIFNKIIPYPLSRKAKNYDFWRFFFLRIDKKYVATSEIYIFV